MVLVACPKCHNEFELTRRRRMGQGAKVDPSKPPTPNELILLSALLVIDRPVTIRELNSFLWQPEYRERFARKGRAWSEKKAQHEMTYLLGRRLVKAEKIGNTFRYSVSESAKQIRLPMEAVPTLGGLS